MDTKTLTRRFDLDWMRMLAILMVFLYHTVRAFNLDPWSIKNAVTYPFAQLFTGFQDVWMMPFVFVISGASLFYALGKSGQGVRAGKFLMDKVLRLLVPLVVADFTHIIVDVYIDRITNGKFVGSFIQFLPHYFDGFFLNSTGDGNFAPHGLHLWYLLVLFIFSVLLLPLFALLKTRKGTYLLSALTKFMAVPGVFYVVLVLPVVVCQTFLDRHSLIGTNYCSWSLPVYMCFFISGFVIISSEQLQLSIQRLRWLTLVGTAALATFWILTDQYAEVLCWFIVLTFLGFGMKHLNVNTRFLQYGNDAVLPFYIQHQSLILMVGFFVLSWPIPDTFKWAIITFSSFAFSIAFYEYAIRRNDILRVLFGMKPSHRFTQTKPNPSQVVIAR